MDTTLTNQEIKNLLTQLQNSLHEFKADNQNLAFAFETAAKHIPVYLKIVKGHIEQLEKVLALESHHHRKLSDISLAEPVNQLMGLFGQLSASDLTLIENLAVEASNWTTESAKQKIKSKAGLPTEV